MSKRLTWEDLKKFSNSLPKSELKKEVIWWGDEVGGTVVSVYRLAEDFVVTDYGVEPLSSQDEVEEGQSLKIAYKKGTPILSVD